MHSETLLDLTDFFLHQEVEIMSSHQYDELLEVVKFHNEQYYLKHQPLISDQDFDQLFSLLKKHEQLYPQYLRDDSPTQRLVGQVQDGFNQATHLAPLLSLENTYNASDLEDSHKSIARVLNKQEITDRTYTIEPKYDGLSIELIYKEGMFVQAITRGDGLVGEDITLNVKMIPSIPQQLQGDVPSQLSVRGEIVMPKSVLSQINQERIEQGQEPFVNTRNAAAGSVKQLDTTITAKRGLVVRVYDIIFYSKEVELPEHHEKILHLIKSWGLPVYDRCIVKSTIQEVIEVCENPGTKEFFEQQDIEFDGLVIKIQQSSLRKILGVTNHHPKRAVAYKFPAQQILTTLESVDYQVGRTGVITPAGNLSPVKLSGATISRVSLHNFDMIEQKDIHIGDKIWIQRSGEVIPYVVAVAKEYRTGQEKKILPPDVCPVCQTPTIHEEGSPFYKCPNPVCPARVKQALIYFISRDAMNIDGVGDALIELLVDQGIVKTIADLYALSDPVKKITLTSLPGIGEKKYSEMIKQIELSKKNPLRRRINGIGIEGIGKKTAKVLEQELSTKTDFAQGIKDLLQVLSDEEFLSSIYGMGKETVQSIQEFISTPNHIELLYRLQELGWVLQIDKPSGEGILEGKHFAITGTFEYGRQELVARLESQGGVFDSEPLKTTIFLLAGAKAGSKLQKAEQYGITIYQSFGAFFQEYPNLQESFQGLKKQSSQSPQSVGLFG